MLRELQRVVLKKNETEYISTVSELLPPKGDLGYMRAKNIASFSKQNFSSGTKFIFAIIEIESKIDQTSQFDNRSEIL